MSTPKDISRTEWEVMEVLWRRGQATVKQVQADLAYEFRPLVRRNEVVRRKLCDLVKRVLGGDVSPLAAYIVENRKLTPEQLDAVEQIVKSPPKADE